MSASPVSCWENNSARSRKEVWERTHLLVSRSTPGLPPPPALHQGPGCSQASAKRDADEKFATVLRCTVSEAARIVIIPTFLGSEIQMINQSISGRLTPGTDRLRPMFARWLGFSLSPMACLTPLLPPSRLRVKRIKKITIAEARVIHLCSTMSSRLTILEGAAKAH